MRKPEPWYWGKRQAWYVQIGKKQIKLGEDLNPRPREQPRPGEDIMREYYRRMAVAGRTPQEDRLRATVVEVCELFLLQKEELRPGTIRCYKRHLKAFASALSGREFRKVTKEDIVRVADSRKGWNDGSRFTFVGVLCTLFTWARNSGYLEFNPLAGWTCPYARSQQTRSMTEDEFSALLNQAKDINFKQVLMFMRGTGCRLGELMAVEARHLDPERPLVILEAALHKTGRRTKKPRVLVLPADIELMVRTLARRHPKGPLFRNSRGGKAWGKDAINTRVRRYRQKLGLSDKLVPHMIRHASLSRMLDNGVPDHLVAKIAGHGDTNSLHRTYYHPDIEIQIAAVNAGFPRKKK